MKMKTHTARSGQGASASAFTLIETLVAIFIGAVMLPTLYACLGAGFSMMKVTRENLRATQVIVQRMEAIRLASYNSIQSSTAFPTNVTEYYSPSGQNNGTGGNAYTVTYNCAPIPVVAGGLPPTYRSNMVVVTVTASWQSGKTRQSRSMQSYVAKYGVQRYVAGY